MPERYHAFGDVDISRAIDTGLSYRPLEETLSDTLVWARTLPREPRVLRFGKLTIPNALSREREKALLELWRERFAG